MVKNGGEQSLGRAERKSQQNLMDYRGGGGEKRNVGKGSKSGGGQTAAGKRRTVSPRSRETVHKIECITEEKNENRREMVKKRRDMVKKRRGSGAPGCEEQGRVARRAGGGQVHGGAGAEQPLDHLQVT